MTPIEKVEFMLDAVRVLNTALKAVVGKDAAVGIHAFSPMSEDVKDTHLALALCLRDVGGVEKEHNGAYWVVCNGVTVFIDEPLPPEPDLEEVPF